MVPHPTKMVAQPSLQRCPHHHLSEHEVFLFNESHCLLMLLFLPEAGELQGRQWGQPGSQAQDRWSTDTGPASLHCSTQRNESSGFLPEGWWEKREGPKAQEAERWVVLNITDPRKPDPKLFTGKPEAVQSILSFLEVSERTSSQWPAVGTPVGSGQLWAHVWGECLGCSLIQEDHA